MTYAAVRGFAEIVRRLLNAGGDVITPRWSMCPSRRRSEKVVLTGADNSPDVVGPRGARTVLVVSNLGSTWNDRTVCAEQKIVPGAARHPVAATRWGWGERRWRGAWSNSKCAGRPAASITSRAEVTPWPHRHDKHWATTERSERKFRPTVVSHSPTVGPRPRRLLRLT